MLGIIAGTSLRESELFRDSAPRRVDTPYGWVNLFLTAESAERPAIAFCQRHDREGVFAPPHNVNHRANVWALREVGVTRIVAFCSVGGCHEHLGAGTVVVPDDYLCPFTPISFSEYGPDCKFITPAFDEKLRQRVIAVVKPVPGIQKFFDTGVYMQTVGPRFETKAEVRMMRQFGDVLGMTGASEATLAQELDLPFALVCMIDNHANGVTAEPLTYAQFKAAVAANRSTVEAICQAVVTNLAHD